MTTLTSDVPAAWTTPDIHFERILVATDFSEVSREACRYAQALAEKLGASVTLLHVLEEPSFVSGTESVVLVQDDEAIAQRAESQIQALARQTTRPGTSCTPIVRRGKPHHEILAAAKEDNSDLIVVGSRDASALEHFFIGSTAERVVRHAQQSVLVVRRPTKAQNARE